MGTRHVSVSGLYQSNYLVVLTRNPRALSKLLWLSSCSQVHTNLEDVTGMMGMGVAFKAEDDFTELEPTIVSGRYYAGEARRS